MTFVSYAQNFEDVLLWRAFRTVGQGFYIDVGASHPDVDSVTRAFYDRGWRGINIEPVPELFTRLSAARPRDINLNLAAGAREGEAAFHVIAGTGLSTSDAGLAAQHRDAKFDVRSDATRVATLADICRDYAPDTVHFLKIDAEGDERAVLLGADFTACRPWIILAESTAPGTTRENHDSWEDLLLDAGYAFLYFDGLNRYYAASEHFDDMAAHFRVPVCVFDDFLRAADSEWTRRISHAEMQAAELLERSMTADAVAHAGELRAHDAERRADAAHAQAAALEGERRLWEQRADAADARAQGMEADRRAWEGRAGTAEARWQDAEGKLQRQLSALRGAQEDAASLRASTSWRITAPVRRAGNATRALKRRGLKLALLLRGRPGAAQAPVLPMPNGNGNGAHTSLAPRDRAAGATSLRAVHQFHAGSAYGDAITNAMLMLRTRLRSLGYRSEIYVAHPDPALGDDVRTMDEMPLHADYVLLLHHSMGFDAFDRIVALPAPKILIYHNITPASLFPGQPEIQRYIALGHTQLAQLREQVVASLADSEYNALTLRRLGFVDPQSCALLFDLEAMRKQAGTRRRRATNDVFTILFVGRVVPSKGQFDLVRAYAKFRQIQDAPSRLILVGRQDGAGEAYVRDIRSVLAELKLEAHVTLTGLVSEDELRAQYRSADLYVSLSRHEGFGVPLVEAAVAGVPVLAVASGAVGLTLGNAAGILPSRDPEIVAARLAELAADSAARMGLAKAQREAVGRFALDEQMPALHRALARAGAVLPPDPRARAALRDALRFTVTGHVNGSYSLAAINRGVAHVLDEARPGAVRLAPVEGTPTARLDGIPPAEAASITALAARPPHEAGPVIVISQHYPVHVPEDQGDAALAYVFWEETSLPAATIATLNSGFRGVLAPSRFVAKALIDSGLSIPVTVVGFAPDLAPFAALADHHSRSGPDAPFTFLHVSSAFPRKGVDVLLAAYARAFRAGDAVRLILKTFPNPHNDVAAQIAALTADYPDLAPIELIDRDVPAEALAALMAQADAMVLPTRGEGFNLPAAEAMAAGLKLIVTGFGGHMDFCHETNARLLRYRLAPSSSHVASAMSLWAEPDVDDLVAAMREVQGLRAAAETRSQCAQETIARDVSAARFVSAVEAAALDALLVPARPLRRLCVISSWNVRCGIAEYTNFLVGGLRRADPALDIAVLSDTRPTLDGRQEEGVRSRPLWALGSAHAPEVLGILVAAEDPDVVLIQHQPGLLPWATLGCTLSALASPDRALAVTLHNTAHLLEVEEADRQAALAGLALASRVIVHSVIDVERLRAMGLAANVVLIPHGAPDPARANGDKVLAAEDVVTIGSYGFLLRDKGIPALIEAAGMLRAEWPRIRLRLINAEYGNDESRAVMAASRAAIRAAGLEGAAELVTDFLSNQESLAKLAGCDIIVLPYQKSKEGASGALRIALSTGACVAVTPLPLFDDAAGVVFRLPGTDAAALADGLRVLIRDREQRASLRAAAKLWIEARSWDAVACRTLGMLRGLIQSSGEPDANGRG